MYLADASEKLYSFKMKLHGQRWLYRIGNAEICVDNAFSWWGWTQERWLINGQAIRHTEGWFSFKRSFDEPWLTPLGDGILAAELRSQGSAVHCRLTLDDKQIDHDVLFETSWSGRRAWPKDESWIEVESFSVFAMTTSG